MSFRAPRTLAAVLGPLAITVACGRTGLFLSSGLTATNDDAADAGDTEPGDDASAPPDDAPAPSVDAPIVLVPLDAPIDSTLPSIDAALPPEAGLACGDGSTASTAYLISQGGTLYRFDPPTRFAVPVASLLCPGATSVPFTMTVTEGAAYVLEDDSSLYRVDLHTFVCTRTAFDATTVAFVSNLGLASAYVGGKESLYVLGCAQTQPEQPCVATLARVDLTTFAMQIVNTVQPLPADMQFPVDMKADGFGRLFAIDMPGTLVQIDSTSALVLGADETGFDVTAAEALLTWNGAIYLFGQSTGQIDIYDLATKKLSSVGQIGDAIVGAGSAPCIH